MKKILLLFLLIINPSFAEMMCDVSISDYFAIYEIDSYTCDPGQYLPANTLGCVSCTYGHACPGGTYNFNETIDQGINTGSYTCTKDYFLPAGSDTCVSCPNGWTCPGGTFDFNDDIFQGAIKQSGYIKNNLSNLCSTNAPHELSAVMTPNEHKCAPGYYLPVNVDGCRQCVQNNKCIGGTFTFNETTNQGIEQCSNPTPFAPVGSTICYPHVLHIGDDVVYLKSTKMTMPSLNVGMDDGIFYANMTTVPTPMNAATDHYLKIEYDGVVYYVCDDSTYTR